MKNLICIVCPMGCHLTVTKENNHFLVEGNQCKRGEGYALEEMTAPKRVLPTTICIRGAYFDRLPVKTDRPIPKDKLLSVMRALDCIVVTAPIKCGEIIVHNILETGADIVASRDMKKGTRP